MNIRPLLVELAHIRRELAKFGIRDEAGYAELLVAQALKGKRHKSSVEQGSDLIAPKFGKVEVRSRTLPLDGRNEARLNLPAKKRGRFNWFAGVIFNCDLTVREAFLLPHDAAWECAALNKRNDVTPRNARQRSEYVVLPGLSDAEKAFGSTDLLKGTS